VTDLGELAAIARHGLADAVEIELPEAQHQPGLITDLQTHRLVGIAASALAEGALPLADESAQLLLAAHDTAMAQTIRVELAMLRAVELLDDAGIAHRVLKGSALAHMVARDPSEREFRDVDLLIPADSIDDAVQVFAENGAHRSRPELRPGFDRRFGKSVTLRLDGVEVDLHRVLSPGPFGALMYPSDLMVLRDTFTVAGRSLPTLDLTDHLLHACYHVALGQAAPSYSNLRDVAQLVATDFDLARLEETVGRWQGTPVLARASHLLQHHLGIEPPVGLRSFTMSTAGRRMLEPYILDGDRFPALASATLKVLPLSDRAAFALAVGIPSGTKPADRARELWGQRASWR
jgi:hypothetical protein